MKKIIQKIISVLTAAVLLAGALSVGVSANVIPDQNVTASSLAQDIEKIAVVEDGTTIKLIEDSSTAYEEFCILIESLAEDITIDLNGHRLEGVIGISDSSHTLTIRDSIGTGSIEANNSFDVAHLVIDGGSYYGDADLSPAIQIGSANTKIVEIKSGSFYGGNAEDAVMPGVDCTAIDVDPWNSDSKIEKFTIADGVVIKGGSGSSEFAGGHGILLHSALAGTLEIGKAQISGGDGLTGGDAIHAEGIVNIKLNGTSLAGGNPGGMTVSAPEGSTIEKVSPEQPSAPETDAGNTPAAPADNTAKSPKTGDSTAVPAALTALFAALTALICAKKARYAPKHAHR